MIETTGSSPETKSKKKTTAKPVARYSLGRPRKYENDEQIREAIEKYMNTTPFEEWTITGLCHHLGLTRETLCEYEKREDISDTVKKAKQMIEHSYEIDLKSHGRTGTIFALKNFGWKDKTESDLNHSGNVGVTMQITNYSSKNDSSEK